MKLIRNIRKRNMHKFKARLRLEYKKKLNEKIDVLEKEYQDDLSRIIKRRDLALMQKEKRYEQDIEIIRTQERNKYEPIINEREKEIERLRKHINDRKKYFDALQEREFLLEETTRQAVTKFERGLSKIGEGIAFICDGQDGIDRYNQKQIKLDAKNAKIIKEQ